MKHWLKQRHCPGPTVNEAEADPSQQAGKRLLYFLFLLVCICERVLAWTLDSNYSV